MELKPCNSILSESVYPGRGIVIGQTPDARAYVQVYWIMGRSPTSRNRVFITEGDFVKTDTVDKSQEVDPLTLYYPAKTLNGCHIITNGDQTDTIYEALQDGGSFASALDTRTFEPDGPNFTPRISGVVDLNDKDYAYRLCVIKTLANNPDYCTRQYFGYAQAVPGLGHCITTYPDDGSPLPSFSGEPFLVELFDDLERTTEFYWDILNADNRVSLMAKFIDVSTGATQLKIINKY